MSTQFWSLGRVISMAVLCVCSSSTVSASYTPALTLDHNPNRLSSFIDGVIGWEFIPSEDLEVTSLGYLDPTGAGFSYSHEVGLFTLDGELISSTLVQADTASPIRGQFRYEEVTPIVLSADVHYVIAGGTERERGYSSLGQAPDNLQFAPEVAFVGGRTHGGGTSQLRFPDYYFTTLPGYFGPNFEYKVVPEPSVLGLMGIAVFVLSGRRGRGRRA